MVKFNRSQSLGLDIDRHIAIDAGAGTGKTTVMASRYIQHLLSRKQRATILLPPAPRIPLKGQGAIRCPSNERSSLDQWPGLLPTETVAITFTRKAAAELKARIRKEITRLRAQPVSNQDEAGVHDVRLRNQGDVEMLLSLLDDAPISTIDSFLSSIVTPWIGLVSEDPASEQIDEDSSIILREEAIRAAWRLQSPIDGIELGLSGNIDSFLQSRNRLSVLLGGQNSSSTVIRGMLKKSLFVEEASRNLNVENRDKLQVEDFEHLFLDPVNEILDDWYSEFRGLTNQWCNYWLDASAGFVLGADEPVGMTRFRYLQYLCTLDISSDAEKLQWIFLASHAMISDSNLKKMNCKPLPSDRPPKSKGWPSGILTKRDCTLDKDVKEMIIDNVRTVSTPIRELLATNQGFLLRNLGKASFLFNPILNTPSEVPGQMAHPPRLSLPIPQLSPASEMRLSTDLELQVIKDLFTVHKGVKEILSKLKTIEGVVDHDDMHRLAEDLLLTRCPSVCRKWYPTSVIDELDSISGEPWTDDHLNRAITACGENTDVKSDLLKRIDLLRNLRRQFRAFIIDEYQDTNPQHFRLLARLWGRRKLESDESPPPAGDWDPTICIVGDMKQSIYRFRQAEVTVMRRAVDFIRSINSEELLMENRMNNLRKPGSSRDPRPIPGKGGETSTFESAKDIASDESKREEWISHKLDDFDHNLSSQSESRRAEGHIEMSTNYRTSPRLLETMNNIFEDTFDERHHTLPGPWHAEAQNLLPGKTGNDDAKLEWILPARTSELELDLDPQIPKNPFIHQGSKDIELCADLLAKRISALLNKSCARIFDSENNSWIDVSEPDSIFRPEDVMILVASRKRIPLLVKALEKYGVPAMADKQGLLLHRPVIKPMMAMLELLINPNNRVASLGVARSVIVGLSDEEISNFISNNEANQLDLLIQNSPNERVRILLTKVKQLSEQGNIRKAIDTVVDYSDLLYFYPKEGDRQDVENWLDLYDKISKLVGDDPAIISNRLKRLFDLGNDGPKSSSPSTSGAVEILTIHSSKGLESPIVVLYDLFSTGTRDSSFASNDNVLVTPNIVAGRIHPWKGDEKPESGSWTLASMFDNGQQLAERRRQFYVSLTRAEKRLIIAGGIPEKTKTAPSGAVEIRRGDGRQTMGTMFLDGLAYSSIKAGNEGCPWSNGGIDQTNNTLTLNPGALYQNSYLSSNSVQSISIFHQPECFEIGETISIVDTWKARYETIQNVEEMPEDYSVQNSNFTLPLASHSLDNAWSCRRRYWLSSVSNWNSERFDFIPSSEARSNWPKATEFGSLFHRLLEIGLANPGSEVSDLDSTWVSKQEDKLSDEKVLSEVLAQSTITDHQILENTKQRLHELGEITRNGNLGLLTLGKEFDGFKVEGLRTELPFYLSIRNSPEGLSRNVWTPKGDLKVSDINTIETIFNGRIDLALALENKDGSKWLQVVDSKTTGCLDNFNSEDPDNGHRLQRTRNEHSPYAETPAEEEILRKHRLQLALYCMALEESESTKPLNQRRTILPPAIHVAASGRMIRMRDDEYLSAMNDLQELIVWIGEISATSADSNAPERLPIEEIETCNQCPFFSGNIKLCGPKGHQLGQA